MTRRARRGRGSVFYDKSKGLWVGQLSMGRDPETGRRKRSPKVSAPTEDECWEKLDKLREEVRTTGRAAPRNVNVERAVRDLLANPPADWRAPSTFQVNTRLAERIIRELGKTRLVSLTPGDVERFLARMVREGLATKTIGQAKSILARAIRRAERDGMVGRNVAELAETPRGTRRESKSMTLEQIRALFGSGLTPWWRAYLMTGILCGLRPGELTGLTWDDVDFAAGVIRVRHSLKDIPGPDGRGVLQLEELKTERSRRTLQLPAKVAEALRALRTVQAADRLRLGPHYGEMNLVFCSAAGRPLHRQSVNRGFKRVCRNAGIGAGWHPHEQRHTFVSVLSDAGIDIELIADAAGHVNSNVTRTVYRHSIADKVTRASAAMDEIFGTGS